MAVEGPEGRCLARRRALALLARREHSQLELRRKLTAGGHPAPLAAAVVAELAALDLQSEARFVDGYIRSVAARGQGPLKMRAGLLRRGVAAERIDAALADREDWLELARQALVKRFGQERPSTVADWARRGRFLAGRGFPADVVATLLDAAPAACRM